MKKTMMMAAVLVLVGCGPKKEAARAADSPAMARAATDTGMSTSHDSTAMSSDSTMARDTTKK